MCIFMSNLRQQSQGISQDCSNNASPTQRGWVGSPVTALAQASEGLSYGPDQSSCYGLAMTDLPSLGIEHCLESGGIPNEILEKVTWRILVTWRSWRIFPPINSLHTLVVFFTAVSLLQLYLSLNRVVLLIPSLSCLFWWLQGELRRQQKGQS